MTPREQQNAGAEVKSPTVHGDRQSGARGRSVEHLGGDDHGEAAARDGGGVVRHHAEVAIRSHTRTLSTGAFGVQCAARDACTR